jgi:hypothetical protein
MIQASIRLRRSWRSWFLCWRSAELADLTLYVIGVSAGDKIPRKGGPGKSPVKQRP